MVVVTKISSIYVICWYIFVFSNQLKMLRFIKIKVDTYLNVLKVPAIYMEPTTDLLNKGNITNITAIEGFYKIILLRRLH